MTSEEMLQVAESVGLGPKELAHLLGVSVRTVQRGSRDGGTVDLLLKALKTRLEEPRAKLSVRALMIVSARGEGLAGLLTKSLNAYVTMDGLMVR